METLQTINKEVAFLKCNRLIDKKNIIQKIQSIKSKGIIGVIFYLPGDKVVNDGYEIVDSHGNPISNPENYIVIIDGQHRIKAALDCNYPADKIRLTMPGDTSLDTMTILLALNNECFKWNGNSYLRAAYIRHPESKDLAYMNLLAEAGFPLSTISWLVTLGITVNQQHLNTYIATSGVVACADIERAKLFLENARKVGFSDKYLKKRYLIEGISKFIKDDDIDYKVIFNNLLSLDFGDISVLESIGNCPFSTYDYLNKKWYGEEAENI